MAELLVVKGRLRDGSRVLRWACASGAAAVSAAVVLNEERSVEKSLMLLKSVVIAC